MYIIAMISFAILPALTVFVWLTDFKFQRPPSEAATKEAFQYDITIIYLSMNDKYLLIYNE